jgi:hypothetical protein
MSELQSETIPEDVREAFADAIWLYQRWSDGPADEPAPTIDFRRMKVSLSGICDLVTAYKNEPMPIPVHDNLWRLVEEMKLKAELAIDPSYATGARCLDALIQRRRASHKVSPAPLATGDEPHGSFPRPGSPDALQ